MEHNKLKEFIAANPSAVALRAKVLRTEIEHRLPTGDAIDVLFTTRSGFVAVEVKSEISAEEDLVRGVFQCLKYETLLNAVNRALGSVADEPVPVALQIDGERQPVDEARRAAGDPFPAVQIGKRRVIEHLRAAAETNLGQP